MKNIGQLMKQAQEMQAKMAEMQAQLEAVEMTGAAGGGMVQLTLNGKGDVKQVKIDKAVRRSGGGRGAGGPDRRGVQRRPAKVTAHAEAEMQKLTGGLQLPGGMKLPF